jgi:Putative addiction module component
VIHYQIPTIAMTLENLEAEVLSLPRDSQATLLARLLEHLGQSSEIDQEVASVWAEEAALRDRAMDDGQVAGVPAQQMFQRIRASLQ